MNFKAVLLSIVFILALFAAPSHAANNTQSTKKPNVVLIFADDMGYGDLSCYGHPVIKTPHLDNMAGEGVRFTSFYAAASVCTPSRAALLTGRYPIRNIPTNCGPPDLEKGLPVSEITIASLLKEEGYATMAIGKWHLGHGEKFLPTNRGFDCFYGLPYSNDMLLPWCPWLSEDDKLYLYEDDRPVKEIGWEQDDLTKNYTEKALEFNDENSDEPFFLYLAHSMPHLPIATSEEFRGQSEGGLYGDVIEAIDWSTGQILSKLKSLGLDENTLVIFTSDNGPWHNLPDRMLQRGVERWHAGSTGLLRGAKATSWEGGFRVPGIVRWPSQIKGNRVIGEMATTMDLFTTIAGVCGAPLPVDRKIDGNNLLPLLKGEENSPTETLFYCRGENLEAVRHGEWKYRFTKNDGMQLFNLLLDPAEMYNVAERNPDVVAELHKEMEMFSKETGAKLAEGK
ncbi:MAG: sulfatase [Prolixibacteraceae bacterium]